MKATRMMFWLGWFATCMNTPSQATPINLNPSLPEFTAFTVNVTYRLRHQQLSGGRNHRGLQWRLHFLE